MKHLILALLLLPAPVMAQTTPPSDADKGLSLMQQGAELLFNHMMGQVEPSLQDMAKALKDAQPKLMEVLTMMDDLANYHAPEKLPNGDILLRRKTPSELKLEALPGAETEL
ncbi:MAG: AAA+ family ATPase [Cypionkella sp.]|uniref:AAA+ family ATPase n=1 Tax=Cypionkella sp. TaxID=2811411 RepID=UPI002ABC78A8|nr:AAA+ family ATPase [Cypionkella sp.]MDZ4310422.1 AAA+ family ATPase [Cypionkella sp.]